MNTDRARCETPRVASLRRAIARRLPARWSNRLLGAVRRIDQLAGLPFASRRPGAVCLFHVGRCGSSVLGEMLHQHPDVKWDREIYYHRWMQDGKRQTTWDSEAYLRRHMWSSGSRWYGFETKFLPQQHLAIVGRTLEEYLAEIARAGVTHHVVLRRRNSLRRMISAAAGLRSGRRHAAADQPESTPEPVHLRIENVRIARGAAPLTLVESLAEIARSYDALEALLPSASTLHLTFEDDIAAEGPQRAYERVCALLGIEPAPARPHTRRLHDRAVRELVANYDEVAAALRGTSFEWMLEG
jgi:hypothetical protein